MAEGGFFSFLDFLRGGIVVGQGCGKKRPIGSRRPSSTATKMRRSPWAKQRCNRGCERLVSASDQACVVGQRADVNRGDTDESDQMVIVGLFGRSLLK